MSYGGRRAKRKLWKCAVSLKFAIIQKLGRIGHVARLLECRVKKVLNEGECGVEAVDGDDWGIF